MKNYTLEIIVFVSGTCVMIFEIVGSRLLSPYLGSTIVVWTSLIGVILASLSLGYWLGGKMADKDPNYKTLAKILLIVSLLLFIVAFCNGALVRVVDEKVSDLRLAAFLSSVLLFGPASVSFGMVSPYSIRLKLKSLKKSGSVTGSMLAISTVGSILGTFGSGFYLLGKLGSIQIIYLLSLTVFLNAIYIYILFVGKDKKIFLVFLLAFLSGVLFWNISEKKVKGAIADLDTNYSRIIVAVERGFLEGKDVLTLRTGRIRQSGRYLDSDELVFDYTKHFRLAKQFSPNIGKSLMIGGGGFSYAKDFLVKNPKSTMDVVEIDSEMVGVAKRYFGFEKDPRLTIYYEDGRRFINKTDNKYDAIYIDAFTSDITPPFQLTTIEAVSELERLLNKNGVVMVNMGGSLVGRPGKIVAAQYKTYKQVFDKVFLFPVRGPESADQRQNVVLAATNSQNINLVSGDKELAGYLNNLYTGELELDVPLLTDNFAPVEYYMIAAYIN